MYNLDPVLSQALTLFSEGGPVVGNPRTTIWGRIRGISGSVGGAIGAGARCISEAARTLEVGDSWRAAGLLVQTSVLRTRLRLAEGLRRELKTLRDVRYEAINQSRIKVQ